MNFVVNIASWKQSQFNSDAIIFFLPCNLYLKTFFYEFKEKKLNYTYICVYVFMNMYVCVICKSNDFMTRKVHKTHNSERFCKLNKHIKLRVDLKRLIILERNETIIAHTALKKTNKHFIL